MFKQEGLIISLDLVGALEVRGTEIGMIFVLMPTSMEARIRVAIINAEPVVPGLAIPSDD
jgi:hypothetical protein